MLTKVKEQDTVKCVEYWKNKVNDDSNYLIKTTHIDSNVDYTVTSLEITDSKAILFHFYVFTSLLLICLDFN